MKNIKAFFCLMLMLVGLAACNSDDNLLSTTGGNGNAAAIRFTLGGSAKTAASRAAIAADDNEKAVNSVLAVLFDTHKGFYKTVEARPTGDAFEVLVEDDATYDIYFFANANANLKAQLENIPDTARAIYAKKAFADIIADQAPDGTEGGFLMMGITPKRVSTTLTKTYDLGTVKLSRWSLRFDIVNKAEGITVNSVTFNKRAVKTSILHYNYMPADVEGLYETAEYKDLNLEGKADGTAALKAKIYSYRNISLEKDSVSTLTIEYTEDGQTRTHEVAFINPSAPAGTPLALHINRLFTITLTKAYKLNFELSVEDWNDANALTATELPIDLPEDVQDELNSKLLVYDLFADTYVASISNDKIVTFMDPATNIKDMPREGFFSPVQLSALGLFNNGAELTDAEGNKYRLPTVGEMQLLSPKDEEYIAVGSAAMQRQYPMPFFSTSAKMSEEPFTEEVYLKNDINGLVYKPAEIKDDDEAFAGTSQLYRGLHNKTVYQDADGNYIDKAEGAVTTLSRYACYAIRFKGSSQYSAYKWEAGCMDENGIFYLSIKIKALPEDFALNVYDIADNYSFWENGYFEIKIPYTGDYYATDPNLKLNLNSAYLIASTKYATSPSYYYLSSSGSQQFGALKTAIVPLRLVKIKEAAETPAE